MHPGLLHPELHEVTIITRFTDGDGPVPDALRFDHHWY